ncbi:Multidrug resistance protein MdtE precursor [compost metagenome]
MEQAQDNFNRLDQLYKKGSLPERDYISGKTGLAQAKANKETASKNMHDTKLYASFSGIVTHKLTEAGASAAPGIPAFTIVKTDKVYAVAAINENEITSLKIGADANITIPSLNREIKGKITIINPQGDDLSKTYTVKVRLENVNGQLLPGMIADISINSGQIQNTIIIPAQALVRDPDNINYVYIAKEGNTAFKKRVNISKITGTNDVVVKEGLQAGDKIIVNGQTNLIDGTPVKF